MTASERFNTYLLQWESMAEKATASGNPADYALNNNGRTIFFMTEALCKIYKNLHNEKLFSKLGDRFKQIEDLLGDMDHYRECIDSFSEKEVILPQGMQYFHDKYQQAQKTLNSLFEEKGWLTGKRTAKTRKKLEEADWLTPKKEVEAVRKYYISEIEQLKDLYRDVPVFTSLEEHLHEFRRRLRWFSIYPHALQGAVQTSDDSEGDSTLLKYQTPEVLSSPFNKFPGPGNQSHVLLLKKANFLALSWLIDALGKLKDKGLLAENLLEAMEKTRSGGGDLVAKQSRKEILMEGTAITRTFMEEKVMDGLVLEVKALTQI